MIAQYLNCITNNVNVRRTNSSMYLCSFSKTNVEFPGEIYVFGYSTEKQAEPI